MKLPFVDRIHPQSYKFCYRWSDLQLNDSPVDNNAWSPHSSPDKTFEVETLLPTTQVTKWSEMIQNTS